MQPLTLPLGWTGIKHPINAGNPKKTENILTSVEWPSAKITFHQSYCKAQAQPCDLGGLWGFPGDAPGAAHLLLCVRGSVPAPGREGELIPGWCWGQGCVSCEAEGGWGLRSTLVLLAAALLPPSSSWLWVAADFFPLNSIPNLFQIKNKRCCISVCQSLQT